MRTRYKKKSKRTGKYKSQLEQTIATVLGKRATYESEVLNYVVPRKYKPDFIVTTPSRKFYLEVKGYMRFEDQQKMKWVKACNPELDIRFYFPVDNKVQGSKMRNSEWCEKYSFKYSIGRLPKGWLN